jgi:molecular chaperone HtpG
MSNGIVFQADTKQVLKILTREIYDSPLALLRENLQNAYDAIRMRFAASGRLAEGGRIDVTVDRNAIKIVDNGIGMTEDVLRENFWKAGSSGKHSSAARKAGVVGTFGIGAMANFSVCKRLTVETRTKESAVLLRSVAERDSLQIGRDCISFERVRSNRDVGTTLTAVLDDENPLSSIRARSYLETYVGLLPVPVFLNGDLISQRDLKSTMKTGGRTFRSIGTQRVQSDGFLSTCDVQVDPNGQVLVHINHISFNGDDVQGTCSLLQSGGQLMGLRSYFGLAPIPVGGPYQFGGWANLSFLQPTAGREALSRESIDQASRLLASAEYAASQLLSKTEFADKNNAFLLWLVFHNEWGLASRVAIRALPEDRDVPLGQLRQHIGGRTAHYYTGTDRTIIDTFSGVGACMLMVAHPQSRRRVQLHHLQKVLQIPEVPDVVRVTKVYSPTELTAPEASVILRIAALLREDYLIPDIDIQLVDMTHGVTVVAENVDGRPRIKIARGSSLLSPALEFRERAPELFGQFMKDFVRVHIYPRVQEFVPSSTKGGVEALRKLLERNRELYRYEETERGDLEGVLGDYLSGAATLSEVVKSVRKGGWWGGGSGQRQRVSSHQVGPLETVVRDVVESPGIETAADQDIFVALPPILREDVPSSMKILTTDESYRQLNGFRTFLGLSDRLMQTEAPFFRTPHTTRVIWGGHRVIYIFTEATGQLSLYYDIELRDPIEQTNAGGGFFVTTTLVTKTRIFIPVPSEVADEFKISSGSREFLVRFDVLSSGVASVEVSAKI